MGMLPFQITNVTLAFLGIAVWLLYYFKYKEPGAIAPLTWLLNLLAYNLFLIFAPFTTFYIGIEQVWSASLRTHAAILLIVAVAIMYPRRAKRGGKV